MSFFNACERQLSVAVDSDDFESVGVDLLFFIDIFGNVYDVGFACGASDVLCINFFYCCEKCVVEVAFDGYLIA